MLTMSSSRGPAPALPFMNPIQQISIIQKQPVVVEQPINQNPPSLLQSMATAKSLEGQQTIQQQNIQQQVQPTMPQPLAQIELPKPTVQQSIPKQLEPYKPTLKKNGKHLVLDLDETLVHTFSPGDNFMMFIDILTDEQRKRIYSIQFEEGDLLIGYIRPYAEEFLKVAFAEFESVGVWSAGTSFYVHRIVEIVFKQQAPKFILSRDQCNELKVSNEEEPCRYKPLEVIYHRYPDHNEKNTMIVDDRHDICALNCMNNIRVPEFNLDSTNYQTRLKDRTLDILARWIQTDEFRNNTDVKLIKSKSPFKI